QRLARKLHGATRAELPAMLEGEPALDRQITVRVARLAAAARGEKRRVVVERIEIAGAQRGARAKKPAAQLVPVHQAAAQGELKDVGLGRGVIEAKKDQVIVALLETQIRVKFARILAPLERNGIAQIGADVFGILIEDAAGQPGRI